MPSDDTTLKNVFISGLSKVDATATDYKFKAINGFQKYVIAAYTNDANATVTGAVVETLDTDFAALNYVGPSVGIASSRFDTNSTLYVVFKVTAENGEIKYHTVEIINPKNGNAALKSLFISGFELGENISSDVKEYNIRKISGFKNYVIAARQKDANAKVQYRIATNGASFEDATVRNGAASNNAIGLKNDTFDYGDVIYVTVLAEDGVTESVYTFNVVKTLD